VHDTFRPIREGRNRWQYKYGESIHKLSTEKQQSGNYFAFDISMSKNIQTNLK
jgi:hypothetical protein